MDSRSLRIQAPAEAEREQGHRVNSPPLKYNQTFAYDGRAARFDHGEHRFR
jgi:hypothetical protein